VEAPINISNVMLWDAKANAATKVKRTRENGKLVRVSKNQEKQLSNKPVPLVMEHNL